MSISIIGTGNMAKGLAHLFANAGYDVVLGARARADAETVAATLGVTVRGASIPDAAQASDIVVLAVPYGAAADVIAAAHGFAGKTVIDITNPLTPDLMGLTVGFSTSAAEEIQKLAPAATIVKAFNTVFAQVLQAGGRAAGQPVTVFVAGDDEAANARVAALVHEAVLSPVATGPLKQARLLEPLGLLNIALGHGRGHGTDIAPTWLGISRSQTRATLTSSLFRGTRS